MNRERIAKIGIEVEGEWSTRALEVLGRNRACKEVKHDGSIAPCGHGTHTMENIPLLTNIVREITTIPLAPDSPILSRFLDAVETLDASGEHHWNNTMGFHIHISFNGVYAQRLPDCIASSPFYLKLAQDLMREFPKAWKERANGQYSAVHGLTHNAGIDEAVLATHADRHDEHTRYEFINTQAFYRHGTVEFRFFPAGSAKDMRRYIQFIVDEVNEALEWKTLRANTEAKLSDGTVSVEEACQKFYHENGDFAVGESRCLEFGRYVAVPRGGRHSIGRREARSTLTANWNEVARPRRYEQTENING